jgi:hypothetical protein
MRTVELSEPLQVETGWARAFVQHGRAILKRDMEKFDPYCSFEITEVAREGSNFQVLPDSFRITRVQHRHVPGGVFAGALNIEEDVGPVEPEVDIYLSSEMQPSVIRLRCTKWEADAIFAKPVNLGEIRATLGQVAQIR